MWLIVGSLLVSAFLAATFVAPLLIYRHAVVPDLARRGAPMVAYIIAAIPAATAVGLGAWLVASYVLPLPTLNVGLFIAATYLALLFSGTTAGLAARLTSGLGRARDRPALAHVSDRLDRAEEALAHHDLHGSLNALREAARLRLETTAEVVDAIRGVLPVAETGGVTTLEMLLPRIRAVEARVWRHESRGARRRVGLLAAAFFLGLAVPASVQSIVLARACIEVESLLPERPAAVIGRVPALTEGLLTDPEPGALMLISHAVDLDAAAVSRHDPDSRRHLVEAGFQGGIVREWEAADGRRIHADVFEFADPAGALRFQAAVNRYACGFANEAFGTLRQGIGLQVRWSTGDPIEEQVSWVSGSRRYLVSVGHTDPPTDHARVLAIAERAVLYLNE